MATPCPTDPDPLLADIRRSLEHPDEHASPGIYRHWLKHLLDLASERHNDMERAYQQLEVAGVPRERAKSVANGIGVLIARFDKAQQAWENEKVKVT